MMSSAETILHVPTIRSRSSDSVCPKTDEPQSINANRVNTIFFMTIGSSGVKFEQSWKTLGSGSSSYQSSAYYLELVFEHDIDCFRIRVMLLFQDTGC